MGTKLRALYQRRKGRDLYDIYKALKQTPGLDKQDIIRCYSQYIKFVVSQVPSQKNFIQNMEAKMQDKDFLGDITALVRPNEIFDPYEAYELVRSELIEKI